MGQDIKGDRKVMKYLRTKDGIYKVLMTNCGDFNTKKGWIKPIDILKHSDSIENLCDVFVLNWANQHRIEGTLDFCVYMSKDDRCLPKNSIKIYGAIWTDKGLIYVAKMNDKGELELL